MVPDSEADNLSLATSMLKNEPRYCGSEIAANIGLFWGELQVPKIVAPQIVVFAWYIVRDSLSTLSNYLLTDSVTLTKISVELTACSYVRVDAGARPSGSNGAWQCIRLARFSFQSCSLHRAVFDFFLKAEFPKRPYLSGISS